MSNNEDNNTIITKEFYIIYHNLLNNRNEKEYIENINKLIEKYNVVLFKAYFTNIKYIKILIFNLKNENLDFAYKMTLVQYVKTDLFNKLIEYKFIKLNKKDINDNNALEIIVYISKILKNTLTFINAFSSMPLSSESIDQHIKDNDNAWYEETRIEIINRLIQLTNYFGINMYKITNIKRIEQKNALDMKYNELAKYYNDIVKKINKYIKKYLCICDAYVELEKTYILTLMSGENKLDLNTINNFELVIEQDDDITSSDSENA